MLEENFFVIFKHRGNVIFFAYLILFGSQGKDVTLEFIEDRGLIAVQGPETSKILESLCKLEMRSLPFMSSTVTTIAGVADTRITRCG